MSTKFQLKNGMDVVFVPSSKSPVISVQAWVHTGSADEPKGLEGISHFIEHLVFKGTDKYKVGELAQKVESSGGQFNAYTSFDQTVFYVTISNHFKEVPFDVLSQMMGYPLFDAEEIDNEREVVIEEIKRTLDNPSRAGSRLLFETSYKTHKYKKPVIGKESVIRKVTPQKIKEYFKNKYTPKNMTLVISGDIKKVEAKRLSEKYFESIPAAPYKIIKRDLEPLPQKMSLTVRESTFKENLIYLSWPIPPAKHKDIVALEVIALILGQGDSSRLARKLRLERALCNYAGSSLFTPKDAGIFVVSASLNKSTYTEFLEALGEALLTFLEKGPTEEEVKKAFINFESDLYYSMETVDGIASTAGLYEHIYSDYKMVEENLESMKELTPKKLLQVARKYLNPIKLRGSLLVESDVEDYKAKTKKFLKFYSTGYQAIKGYKEVEEIVKGKKTRWMSKAKESRGFIQENLSSGSKVVFYPTKDIPIVNIRAGFLGGLRDELVPGSGSVECLSRLWCAGSSKYNEEQVDKILDASASRISAFGGRNTSGLSLTTFNPFINDTFDVFEDTLLRPTLTKQVFEREKPLIIERIRKREDNAAQLCVGDFLKGMFGNHPYSHDMMGEQNIVESITEQTIREQWQKTVQNIGATYVISGGLKDEDYILNKVKDLDAQLQFKNNNLLEKRNLSGLVENKFSFKQLEKEQTHLILGYRGLSLDSEDKVVLDIMQAILSGQGGRLFYELRDKQSLAYSVSPIRMDGIDGGYFGAYIACSPEKVNTAFQGLGLQLSRVAEEGVTTEELAGAKRNLIGRHDISLQKVSAISSALLFDVIYGEEKETTFTYPNRVEAVEISQIKDLAQKIFSQSKVVAVVGKSDINESYKYNF